MSRFTPCRDTTLEAVVKDCAGSCMNRGAPPCVCEEPLILNQNVLADPGLELEFGITAGGPYTGDGLAFVDTTTPWTAPYPIMFEPVVGSPELEDCQAGINARWIMGPFNIGKLSDVNPRSGGYHIRKLAWFGVGEVNYLANFRTCVKKTFTSYSVLTNRASFYSARVEERRT